MMMVMMTVGVWWGDSEVVVMERMSGGAWSRGSDISIDEEYIWSSPERVAGKLFRRWLTTPFQAKWLPKLLGFDYEISYKKGSKNIVADALSRVEGTLLKRKGKVVVGNNEVLRTTIIKHFHADAIGGLLQPLPIPKRVWSKISIDFIVGVSQGKSVIFLVVDRLSKYSYFMALSHPYIAGERPKEWVQWLSLAEFWYNTNKHSSIDVTPFEVVYGQAPPLHIPCLAGESAIELKLWKENANKMGILPHRGIDGLLSVEPKAILDRRIAKLNNKAAVYVLVKWASHSKEDAT
ncbi:putative mitochondrial protein [Tanacetum coccineum]